MWRKRLAFFKNLGLLFVVLLVIYQWYAIGKLQRQQESFNLQQISQLEAEFGEEELTVTNENSEAPVNGVEAELLAVFKKLVEDEEKVTRTAGIRANYTDLAQKLVLSDSYGINDTRIVHVASGATVVSFSVDQELGAYLINLPHEQKRYLEHVDFEEFIASLNTGAIEEYQRLAIVKQQMLSALQAALAQPEAVQLLADKQVRTEVSGAGINFVSSDEINLLTLTVDPLKNVYRINGDARSEFEASELTGELPSVLASLDTRTELEKIKASQLEQFMEAINSAQVEQALKAYDLQLLDSQDRTDGNYFVFGNDTGEKFTIVLERGTGLVKILRDREIILLDQLLAEDKKKTLVSLPSNLDFSSTPAADEEVVLLAGKHGSLTDTLILAYIRPSEEKIKLISIPRDLYWEGRKINSYFADYGMPRLVEELEKLMRTEISHYVLVDMYAFIEVVDILGGVDITLTEALVDPSYKTFDNGEWGTLNYQPGTYHLSGVQALRLARSRQFSSDFARSERQQQILSALQDKASSLSLRNLPTIIALTRAVLSRVETDLGLGETIDYYKRYKDYDVKNVAVLSTGNILYSSYSNQAGYDQCIASGTGNCSRGGYILLPKDDNWAAIPWYVYSLMKN